MWIFEGLKLDLKVEGGLGRQGERGSRLQWREWSTRHDDRRSQENGAAILKGPLLLGWRVWI